MSDNKIITVWERQNEKSKKWEHNHISDGYSESDSMPKPKGSVQKKSWSGGVWRNKKGHLEDISVVLD